MDLSLEFGIFWPKSPGDPSDDLGRSFGIIFSPKFQHPTIFVNHFHVFLSKNMKIQLFGHPLNPTVLGTPPYVQERQILFRIALTRALYDQTAPQLCPFHVPEKLSFSSLVFIWILAPFCYLENTGRRKGKLQSVQFIQVSYSIRYRLRFPFLRPVHQKTSLENRYKWLVPIWGRAFCSFARDY